MMHPRDKWVYIVEGFLESTSFVSTAAPIDCKCAKAFDCFAFSAMQCYFNSNGRLLWHFRVLIECLIRRGTSVFGNRELFLLRFRTFVSSKFVPAPVKNLRMIDTCRWYQCSLNRLRNCGRSAVINVRDVCHCQRLRRNFEKTGLDFGFQIFVFAGS